MAVPENIEQLVHEIRNAIYGRDVREAIASSIEATADVADWSRQVAQDIIDGNFDEGELATEIENKLNQLEQDYAPTLTSLENEIEDARGNESNLGDRLNSVSSQLAQTATIINEVKRALNYYWLPPQQPPARKDQAGFFTDAFNMKFQDYIDGLFEPLRLENPNYITRTSLGKDQSGLYDVWKYELTPVNYEKTLIISSSLHGSEVTLAITMARFLHYLVNEYEKYPGLAYIREKVRIVYVPFANPWGTSQTPRRRYNSRGVDLNRNFDYKWETYSGDEAFGHDYKGASPFSEIESRYIRDLINSYPDVIAHLDLHNTGTSLTKDYYVSMAENYEYKTYEQLTAYFTKGIESPDVLLDKTPNPSLPNYNYHVNGIPSSQPEWVDGMTGLEQYGSEEITKALEWLANVIIEHCRYFEPKVEISKINVANIVTNSVFLDTAGWDIGGLNPPTVADNTLNGIGTSTNSMPYFLGGISETNIQQGDAVFVKVKTKIPPNCTKVTLALRDFTNDITGLISSVDFPTAEAFIELNGFYSFNKQSTAPQLRIQYTFSNASDKAGETFSVKEPLVLYLSKDFGNSNMNESDLSFVFNQTGEWFEGTKEIDFIKNIASLNKSQQNITLYLLSKLHELEQ